MLSMYQVRHKQVRRWMFANEKHKQKNKQLAVSIFMVQNLWSLESDTHAAYQ